MSQTLKHAGTRLVGTILLCSAVSATVGLPTDSQQEMNLSFETSNVDLKKGTAVYSGNVKLTQGSLRIESDELTVHRSGKEIDRVIATGSPAVFEQQPEVGQAPVIAYGKRIEYELNAEVEKVAIVDEAKVEQGGIVSRCERIEFNLTDSTAKMMGSCVTERPAQNTSPETNTANGS